MIDTLTLQHVYTVTETHAFQAENQHETMLIVKKCAAELVRRRGVATLVFRSEKRHNLFSFSTK